jgi:hypothetical protein
VKEKQRLAGPAPGRAWTRPDDYIEALARKRNSRRAHRERLRTQPERPRLMLSTVPFLTLIGLLAVLAVAIMILAIPHAEPQQSARLPLAKVQGVANPGWLHKAAKQFH